MEKTIGIVGLGLIGGSMAKTIKYKTDYKVLAYDTDENVLDMAMYDKSIDGILNNENMSLCDTIIICIYPKAAIDYIHNNMPYIKRGTIIIDCVGVKTNVCNNLSAFCSENNCYFVGGHPMAGIEKTGYMASFSHMFEGAAMILCEDEHTNIVALHAAKKLFESLGFGKITFSTPIEHDKIIAFTSQLAHVVSNAYVQSDTARMQMGFSAGSYKDLTRVAYLNETMWTELFIENKEPLASEVRSLAKRLETYADLIENADSHGLKELLYRGKKIKEMVG